MRFTDRIIGALKPKAERFEVWEDGRTGLGMRVTPRGIRTFVFMFRFGGKARRMTLGRYSKAPAAGISKSIRLGLRLQLATAVRKGEVVGAPWTEFDIGEARWAIPAERSKNRVAHIVPLSELALSVLEEIRGLPDGKYGGAWLLPSPRGDRPFNPASVNHAFRRILLDTGLEDLTPHDLRRTGASLMAGSACKGLSFPGF